MSKGTVLITGITGFLASQTALTFLEQGYAVKATARSAAKAEEWISRFPQHKANYSYAVVADMAEDGSFDEAIKGCDYVAHLASPAHWNTDNNDTILKPAINGTLNVLKATKFEPKVKRVVFTSSFAAVVNPNAPPGHVMNPSDWNPVTLEEAKSGPAMAAYRASKALAEKAFWDYIKTEKPSWTGSVICPCGSYGPPMQILHSLSELNVSVGFMWKMADGTFKNGVPATGFPVFVDARDVALAHLRALERDQAQGQRYLLIGGTYVADQFVEAIGKHFPELKDNLPPVDLSQVEATKEKFKFDNSKATTDLGIQFSGIDDVVKGTIARILELKKQFESKTDVPEGETEKPEKSEPAKEQKKKNRLSRVMRWPLKVFSH
ncbi:hypothetical protein VKT23_013329 [Stygiomarasmius scandens]|uniref:NAD-dependent epimerase/dehydratase domain-containing protein n=1 Tax=Marasmiellus scandens TaxID=2682957 RepID=A0ABR1J5P7_9AGAR